MTLTGVGSIALLGSFFILFLSPGAYNSDGHCNGKPDNHRAGPNAGLPSGFPFDSPMVWSMSGSIGSAIVHDSERVEAPDSEGSATQNDEEWGPTFHSVLFSSA